MTSLKEQIPFPDVIKETLLLAEKKAKVAYSLFKKRPKKMDAQNDNWTEGMTV